MNWHSAELQYIKLALICEMLLKDFIKPDKFQNQFRRRGSLPLTAFLKVLSSSLSGLQGHSFQNALEIIIFSNFVFASSSKSDHFLLGSFFTVQLKILSVLGQEWSCGHAVPSRGAARLCTGDECLIIWDAGAPLPPADG